MPEGPSIVIAREYFSSLIGKKILEASGDAKIDIDQIVGQKVTDLMSWGKHFLICVLKFFLRIHFLMFGTYRLNERKQAKPRLHLGFRNGEANFYTCSVKFFEGCPNAQYDWEKDVMSDQWNPKKARKALLEKPSEIVADALLNQEIFSGVGNIIKNEVLFRTRIHPKSPIGLLSASKLTELIKEVRNCSFEFLELKKIGQLKKHWLVYGKKICPRCKIPTHKEYFGKTKRGTFFCDNCQIEY